MITEHSGAALACSIVSHDRSYFSVWAPTTPKQEDTADLQGHGLTYSLGPPWRDVAAQTRLRFQTRKAPNNAAKPRDDVHEPQSRHHTHSPLPRAPSPTRTRCTRYASTPSSNTVNAPLASNVIHLGCGAHDLSLSSRAGRLSTSAAWCTCIGRMDTGASQSFPSLHRSRIVRRRPERRKKSCKTQVTRRYVLSVSG